MIDKCLDFSYIFQVTCFFRLFIVFEDLFIMSKIIKIKDFIAKWSKDENSCKQAFIEMKEYLSSKDGVVFDFNVRPGISYSLRAAHVNQKERPLFVMVDVIEASFDVPFQYPFCTVLCCQKRETFLNGICTAPPQAKAVRAVISCCFGYRIQSQQI